MALRLSNLNASCSPVLRESNFSPKRSRVFFTQASAEALLSGRKITPISLKDESKSGGAQVRHSQYAMCSVAMTFGPEAARGVVTNG